MKATYRNSLRSKEMIREAMISLLNKKPFPDITVTDIVTTANINRGTFYNHYSNPIDVVEEVKSELINSLTEELRKTSSPQDIDTLIDMIVQHFKANAANYKKIINSIPIPIIDDMKKALIFNIREINGQVSEIGLCLVVNAISGLFLDFLKGQVNFSYEEISKKLKEFIKNTLQII